MIKKTEKLVITFYTTTAAMAMEKVCKDSGADGRLIPVPGSISADCGLAWCAKNESEDEDNSEVVATPDTGYFWGGTNVSGTDITVTGLVAFLAVAIVATVLVTRTKKDKVEQNS